MSSNLITAYNPVQKVHLGVSTLLVRLKDE
jgi:hypothetical protein